ncbi:MAG: tetratricopeptide repeat protein, partial [Bacillota bacterium]
MRNSLFLIYVILIIIFCLAFTVEGSGIQAEDIQNLMSEGEYDQALVLLENNEIENDPDLLFYQALILSWQGKLEEAQEKLTYIISEYPSRLDFYDQSARIYGWTGDFDKAETIVNKAQKIEKAPHRTAILALHAEWQGKWYQAKNLWQDALQQEQGTGLENEYAFAHKKVAEKIAGDIFIDFSTTYSENMENYLALGMNKIIKDGIFLESTAGVKYTY